MRKRFFVRSFPHNYQKGELVDKYIYDRLYSFISKLEILKFKKKHTLKDFSYLPCDYIKGNNFPNKDSEWNVFLKNEFNIFGFYLTYHPVSKYKKDIFINTLVLEDYADKFIELILEINNIKEIVTKKNDVMAFVKASDEYKQIDLTLFPKIYNDNKNLENYDIIKIYGKVEKRFDNYQIIVSKIINLTRSNNEK